MKAKTIVIAMLLLLLIAPSLFAQFTSELGKIPLNTSLTLGAFTFLGDGAFGDYSKLGFSADINLEYKILPDLSAGLSMLTVMNPAVEWYINGMFIMPMLSVQKGSFDTISHRIELGPPMWGQKYLIAGYVFQFHQFLAGLHFYYDWKWGYSAVNFGLGYQLSF